MSNPCVFRNVPNKEDQRRVKLFYSDVLNSKFDDEVTLQLFTVNAIWNIGETGDIYYQSKRVQCSSRMVLKKVSYKKKFIRLIQKLIFEELSNRSVRYKRKKY